MPSRGRIPPGHSRQAQCTSSAILKRIRSWRARRFGMRNGSRAWAMIFLTDSNRPCVGSLSLRHCLHHATRRALRQGGHAPASTPNLLERPLIHSNWHTLNTGMGMAGAGKGARKSGTRGAARPYLVGMAGPGRPSLGCRLRGFLLVKGNSKRPVHVPRRSR